MKKFVVNIVMIIAVGFLFIGCIKDNNKVEEKQKEKIEKEEEKVVQSDPVKEKIDSMTIDEKIGQLIVVGFQGSEVGEELTNLILEKYIGGVILFSENITDANGVINLNNSIKALNKFNKVPLLISVDEEGGSVSRMPYELQNIATSEYIGSLDDENLSYEIGSILSKELSGLGFNMDYAPVLDILSNPENTVIGDRSFSSDKDVVSKLGISTMEGLKDGGVIPVVKHFPGHGDTYVDSHYGLPVVEKTLEQLEELEFVPFKNAIDSGADVVMVSHIILSNIDSENPASISNTVVTDILRKKLGFEGVVVTDDMTMGAITDNFTIEDAAVKAINSGVDMILVCHGYENQVLAIDSIKKAVENGNISEERINESLYRVISLKEKYKINDNYIDNTINIDEINNSISNLFN